VSISLFEDMQWLAERCVQDVELESGIMQRLPDWPAIAPWLSMPAIDRKINDRGILLDVNMAEGLIRAATNETHRLNEQMNALTRGRVSHATKIEALKQWLVQDRGIALPSTEDVKKLQNEDDDNPEVEEEEEKTKSQKSEWKLRKSDIADLIANEATPEDCREALKIRAEVSKVSTRKFTTMLAQASFDGRLRGSMRLGGAQQTMRFASPGANLYNTVRDVFGNADEVAEAHGLSVKADYVEVQHRQEQWLREAIEVARAGDHELIRLRYSSQRKDAQGRLQDLGVLTWISRMTRRTLAARENSLMLNGDYAQIEARITDWLAQQTNMLEAYATGQDVYKINAAGIFSLSMEALTKTMRQSGKVTKLACGFGGGINALLAMGYNYGLLMTEEEAAPIVKAYRESNREVQRWWYATDDAAANAVRRPGKRFPVPPLELVSYFMDPSGADCLCCELPSGRWLRYWQPRLRQEHWDEERTQPKQRMSLSGLTMKGKMWFRRSLYHTVLCENQVQSIGADMLCHGLENSDRNVISTILHVYDSIAAEVAADQAEAIRPVFEQCMLDQPSWTYGLPIGCDIEVSTRFG
jgi:DNA polymerase